MTPEPKDADKTKLPLMTDEELVFLYYSGNDDAFQDLFARHRLRHVALARYLLKDLEALADQSEDVAEEVWMRFARTKEGRGAFKGGKTFRPWIDEFVRNVCLDVRRKHGRRADAPSSTSVQSTRSPDPSPEQMVIRAEILNKVRECQEGLSVKELLCFQHFDVLRHSIDEVAVLTQIPTPSVRGYIHRARTKMRDCLKRKNIALTDVE